MQTTKNSKSIISGNELAAELGVHIKTIYRWADDGKIPFYRAGDGNSSYRFSIEEVLTALRNK